jgi:hypothetical protein
VRPKMQSPPNTPRKASPIFHIELSQPENQFYHPGGLVSGHVHYAHPREIDTFVLTITFHGVNRTFISGSEEQPFQEAVLFKYDTSLHNGAAPRNSSGQQHIAPMEFYFKWRFPSVAENRPFSQCFGAVGNHIWENSRHSLPPSFVCSVPSDDAEDGVKRCSIEYALEAKLYYNKSLISTKKLPIVFLPSRTSSTDPRSNFALKHSPILKDGIEKRDSLFVGRNFRFRAECPDTIVQGQLFNISIFAAFDPLSLPEDFVSRLVGMQISKLVMICSTSVRGSASRSGHNFWPTCQVERRTERRQFRPMSVNTHIQPRVKVNADGSQELEFTFEASMPSYYHPTFRTFLISNNYCFESPIEVRVDGKLIKMALAAPEFTLLSCYASPSTKRISHMNTSVSASQMSGFCVDSLAERRSSHV